MNTFLHKKFRLNLPTLISKQRLLVAISGGQDSICLIKLINECFKESSEKIEAIYIDHQWENNSFIRIRHLINIMQKTMIPLSIYQIRDKTFSEAEARKLRYQAILKHASKHKYQIIITGHNYDDRVETIIQNLLRGTSINGISNIVEVKKANDTISIIKPLINFTKSEITWMCRYFHLPIWSDITNYNHKINRNRLRHELLPYLKNYFNPKIDDQIYKLSELYQDENEYIKQCTIKLYLKSQHRSFIGLNMHILRQQHRALQKRVLQIHFYYNFNKIINTKMLNTIMNLKKSKDGTMTLYLEQFTAQYINKWIYTNFNQAT